jgi:hypothetical protein
MFSSFSGLWLLRKVGLIPHNQIFAFKATERIWIFIDTSELVAIWRTPEIRCCSISGDIFYARFRYCGCARPRLLLKLPLPRLYTELVIYTS